jgi:hypothetical protein
MSRPVLIWTFKLLTTFVVVSACVDPIAFDTTEYEDVIALDGSITTEPGPYTITMSRGVTLDTDTTLTAHVAGASIVLHSDAGESEPFAEVQPGVYRTGGVITGKIGSTYHVSITMPDGATFESEPETLLMPGQVDAIHFRYEARTVEKLYGPEAADVFNIYIDASTESSGERTNFVRWRFTGTYVTETNPEKHTSTLQGFVYKTPWECSGWVVDPAKGGGILRQDFPCACCRCWITAYEASPKLSDEALMEGGEVSDLKIAEVPINRVTFFEKYKVSVDQMNISANAFDFFKVIRTQKDGVSNLFQLPPGKITGNIRPINADYQIIGLFWAASVNRKSIYITKDDVPYKIAHDVIPFPCTSYGNSTATKPADWDD